MYHLKSSLTKEKILATGMIMVMTKRTEKHKEKTRMETTTMTILKGLPMIIIMTPIKIKVLTTMTVPKEIKRTKMTLIWKSDLKAMDQMTVTMMQSTSPVQTIPVQMDGNYQIQLQICSHSC